MWQYNQTVYHADFNTERRRRLASRGQAMPDGGFPIRNISDLKNAIQAYGRATNKPAVKAWIKKRARALGAEDLLPDNWRDDVVKHYGIKGMKWGIRRTDAQLGHKTKSGNSKKSSKSKTVDSYEEAVEKAIAKKDKNYEKKKNLITALTGVSSATAATLATSWSGPFSIPFGAAAGAVAGITARGVYKQYKTNKIPQAEMNKIRKRYAHSISSGQNYVNSQSYIRSQSSQQLTNQMMMDQSMRSSINASLMTSSLSMSGGTNPFMCGMV